MIHELRAALLGLTAFRGLLEEPLMADVRALLCELERLSEQFTFLGNYEEIH